ncbi:hypothetical protein ACHWQZ_G017780 [Mnemiopsis leidyi]
MSKRVRDWTSQDVMVWLTKNMSRLSSAESLRVYVQMQNIDGETLMGYTKSDCSRFGLIRESDFEKILKKLQSHDEKMEKDKKKKSKKKIFGRADNRDSGVDDNCSISEEQGLRQICVNDSPGSANTSGTGSFMSMSGGSTHKNNQGSVQAVVYEKREGPKREVIPEATYMAPEEIHRTSSNTFELPNQRPGASQYGIKFDNAVLVPTAGLYEGSIRVHTPSASNPYLVPDEEQPPSRPVPLYPPLPDPDFGDDISSQNLPDPNFVSDDTYENFDPGTPPPAEEDEWEDEQPSYMNLEEAEDLQCGEPEDIYVNQESQSSSSEEESSDEGGNQENLADIQRRLTLAMANITGKKEAVPSRPPLQPPASGPFGKTSFARGPAEPPLKSAPEIAIPAKPSRNMPPELPGLKPSQKILEHKPDKRLSLTEADSALPPPPPPMKRQSTSPSLISPKTGGMSIKDRVAMLDKEKNNDLPIQSDGGGASMKELQSKIAGLFGGPPPPAAPPSRPPVSERKPPPLEPPSRNPPTLSKLPPQLPPSRPAPVTADLPPPPPPISGMPKPSLPPSLPPPNNNMSRGCYEENEITFPPPPGGGRSPLRPPIGGFKPPSVAFNAPGNLVEDDEGLYTLEPEDDDDNIYNDGDEEIPGYMPHVTSRQMAEEILHKDPQSECYLIRDSTNNPETYPFVISLKTSNSFEHTRLGSRSDGTLAIGTTKVGETTHANLSELIRHHKTTPLNLRGRNVLLRNPVQQ